MPRINDIQTNFTAGELSPRLYGRVDIDRYRNAAASIENCIVYVHGGLARRAGLRFIAPAKFADKHAVLIPYIFNDSQAYIIELGDSYARVFKSDGTQVMNGAVPFEVPTSYVEADVADIDFVQGADTMFLMHGNYRTARLRRYGDAAWVLDDVPWITPAFDEIGTSPETTLAIDNVAVGTGRTLTAGSDTWRAADVGRIVVAAGGRAVITAVTSGTVATADVQVAFPATSTVAGAWTILGSPLCTLTPSGSSSDPPAQVGSFVDLTASVACWRPDDATKFVQIDAGLVQITSITSDTVASGIIHKQFAATVAAQPNAWVLMGSVWGGYNGYPRTGTLYQQRLWLAGSPGFPQTVWGSRIGEYYNFEIGTDADEAIAFTLASDQLNPIANLTQLKVIVALTYGGEFTISGGDQLAITPTNVAILPQSNYGCNNVAPERIGNELIFVQRGDRKVRAMSADKIVTNEYGSPDVSVLAEHVTETGVVQSAYAGAPDSVLWCVRTDGTLATCTLDRDQGVVAWSRQITDGWVESVAVIPGDGGDQVWALVRRTINGVDARYIERLEDDVMTDSAMLLTDAVGKTAWTGLDHLEGRTVTVKGDGVALSSQVVTGGAITTERDVKALEAGLPYIPHVETLRPALTGQQGTSQASHLRINRVICRFRETTGGTVNGAPILARQLGEGVLDQPPPVVTGDVPIDTLGWDIGQWSLVIEQPQPYPFHLQAVITAVTVNE